MKKEWRWGTAGVLTMAMLVAAGATPVKAATVTEAFSAGTGSLYNPYIINSASQLQQLATLVNTNAQDPMTGQFYAAESYELGSDINLSSVGSWTPIGESTAFTGSFNGAGHTITGLTITTAPANGNSGLFGIVSGGNIKNVGLEKVDISTGLNAGGLVGSVTGYTYITDSYADGTVSTYGQVSATGGLIGNAAGDLTLTNAYTGGSVSATGQQASIGGVVGAASGDVTLKQIYTSSTISASGGSKNLGGLIGRGTAQVSSSFYVQGDGGAYGTAEPLKALQSQATFAGWDFTQVWAIKDNAAPSLLAFENPPKLPVMIPAVFTGTKYSVSLGGIPSSNTGSSTSSSSSGISGSSSNGSGSDTSTSTTIATPPLAWSVINGALPPGLTLSDDTLSGSGVPGIYNASLQLGNGEETVAIAAVNFDVLFGTAPPLTITTGLLPDAVVGIPYSSNLNAGFGKPPYKWNVLSGKLPGGLSLSPSGEITGTPSGPDSTNILTVQVTDANNTQVKASFSLSVTGSGMPQIATTTLPAGNIGQAYQTRLSVTGGASPYQWLLLSGTLPDGVTLQTDGSITGTPTASGSYPITVQVMDGNGVIAIEPLTLTINKKA